ncbi:Hypothetical protein A7982_00188 [Minicystis rosea]|nr:Hypothetical protein A7982_00188 [Minicystis rosea]
MGDINGTDRHLMRMTLLVPVFFVPVYVLALRWGLRDRAPAGELGAIFSAFAFILVILVFAVPSCLARVYARPDDASRWRRAALDASAPAFTTLAIFTAARLPIDLWAGIVAALALSAVFVTLVVFAQRPIKRSAT